MKLIQKIGVVAAALLISWSASAQGWNADLGNGKYKNPILHVDYSDPDVCAGGDGYYYMTASTFHNAPGLPILKSGDLVNWELVGYALQEQVPVAHFRTVQHGNGVWAPSIRYHEGEYYIYWGDPDFGIYMVKTANPAGTWNKPVLVKGGKGYIDTCPLWDDDGKAYLSYAFAGSRASVKSVVMLSEMTPDGTQLIGNPAVIFDGHDNHPTVEGSKLYKINGEYWQMSPAGGVKPGWQIAMKSKNIWGPYEVKTVLHQGNTDMNGPHQGGYVETPNGDGWFIHFQDRWAFGRIIYLEPVQWVDGWPIMGKDINNDGIGEPVKEWTKPNVGKSFPATPLVSSDEFNSHQFGLQWQWQANQDPDRQWGWISGNKGYMRLNCLPQEEDKIQKWNDPNLFMQKFPGKNFTATTKFSFENNPDAGKCSSGLIVFGEDYAYIAVEQTADGKLRLVQRMMKDARTSKGGEKELANISIDTHELYFRAKVEMLEETEPYHGKVTFFYSKNGKKFKKLGEAFTPRAGRWVGAKIGLFAEGTARISDSSYADFDWFRVVED
ncbi:MAG: glycoside hydrolase 43 family protein [Mangrovibacterium sp.]